MFLLLSSVSKCVFISLLYFLRRTDMKFSFDTWIERVSLLVDMLDVSDSKIHKSALFNLVILKEVGDWPQFRHDPDGAVAQYFSCHVSDVDSAEPPRASSRQIPKNYKAERWVSDACWILEAIGLEAAYARRVACRLYHQHHTDSAFCWPLSATQAVNAYLDCESTGL